jgi:ABC-2 type transport system ATP-binding protein
VVSQADGRITLQVSKKEAPAITARLLNEIPVADLLVEDPSIEDVIEDVFAQKIEADPDTAVPA